MKWTINQNPSIESYQRLPNKKRGMDDKIQTNDKPQFSFGFLDLKYRTSISFFTTFS